MRCIFFILFLPAYYLFAEPAGVPSVAPPEQPPAPSGPVELEGILEKPLKLRILGTPEIFTNEELTYYLGTLRPNQVAEVLVISDEAFRIRAKAQQGQVAGWVPIEALEPLPPETIQSIRSIAQRKTDVEELIKNKQVAIGMTLEEVRKSLGKPDKTTTSSSVEGESITLDYIKYKNVPQRQTVLNQYGQLVTRTVSVKTAEEVTSITLSNNIVTHIYHSESENPPHRVLRY